MHIHTGSRTEQHRMALEGTECASMCVCVYVSEHACGWELLLDKVQVVGAATRRSASARHPKACAQDGFCLYMSKAHAHSIYIYVLIVMLQMK